MKGLLAQAPLKTTALQVTTTAIGQAIPLTYGYDRNAGRMIFWTNFQSSSGSKGKFGKGGSPPTYKVNVDQLLGFGPMEGIADLWCNGAWYFCYSDMYSFTPGSVSGGQTVTFNLPSSSTANPNGAPIIMVGGVHLGNVSFSQSYNDYAGPGLFNAFTLSGHGIVPLNNILFPAPNTGNYNTTTRMAYASYNSTYGSTSVSVKFNVSIPSGFTINVIYYFDVHNDQPTPLPAALPGMAWEAQLGSGSSGQPVLYPEFSGVGGASVYLNTSPVFPQTQYHVKGLFGLGFPCQQGTLEGWVSGQTLPATDMWASGDCNPADIIADLICSGNDVNRFGTSAAWNHGAGFSSVVLDPAGGTNNIYQYSRYGGIIIDESLGVDMLFEMRAFCHAYSIYLSGTINDQTSLSQVLSDISEICLCAPCWNGAALDFIPYCEISNFGNGATYSATTSGGPAFVLGPQHFVVEPTTKQKKNTNPPVIHEAGTPSDNWNSLALNFKDRSGQTNNNTVIVSDAYDISRQGPQNQGSKSFPWIQIPTIAQNVAWGLLRRNIIVTRHGTYKFKLSAMFSPILSLMDLVTLSEPTLSSNPIPCRVIKIEEQDDFSLAVEAERFVYGACLPAVPGSTGYGISSGGGGSGGGNTNPASVNTPIIFEAIPAICAVPQLWFCVSGNNNSSGVIASITVTNGGAGYRSQPTVTITGGSVNATATATVDFITGKVQSITVITQGSGYGTPVVTITGGGATVNATATATVGSTNTPWAGCVVMMSTDGGSTYNPINGSNQNSLITGPQDMGLVYSSNFPSHTDPDAVNTLNVDLTESGGTLTSFTAAQRDAFTSLCYLQGGGTIAGPNGTTLTIPYELIAYATANLSSANKYAIPGPTAQIRRGAYSTPIAVHNIGSQFSYLEDGLVFKWNLPNSLVGTTLHFKFPSFNQAGGALQPLSSCTDYTFTPTGQVGWAQATYVITPNPAVYQGQAGGWPGVDTNSTTWTNTAFVYVPPTTATFSNGKTLFYNARDTGFNVFTVAGGGETAWVTVFDPTQVGETPGNSSLTMFCDISSSPPSRWTTAGYIRIGTIVSKPLAGGGGTGGGGGSTGTSGPYMISFFEGDPTAAGTPANNQILLTHKIPTQFGGIAVNNVQLPQNLTGSVGGCKVNPTSAATITIKQNGSSIGTINISTGGVVTFTFASAVTLSPGDVLDFVNQASADLTLSGIFWTISGLRN